MTDLVDLLGKQESSREVADVVRQLALHEVMDDPPYRRYLMSRDRGIDLLLENAVVVAVQIYVRRTRKFSAFSDALPFGLRREMTQSDLLRLLGEPLEIDAYDAKYALLNGKAKLVVRFDESQSIDYLSLETVYSA